MVKAPDLSRPEWQAATSDEQIAAVIREGRNKMPRFELPPAVINVLVRRIRSLRGR
jgi:cytochrome c oxidase cbb3-type subunit 3